MKPHDEDEETASPEEMREAAALAAALESNAVPPDAGGGSPAAYVSDALEAAALLRNGRAPLNVPAAHEAIVTAHVAPALDARRARRRQGARVWITASAIASATAAVWLFYASSRPLSSHSVALRGSPPPTPSADLLAAQAQATRGGSQATGALAALDLKMRAYRRQYHDGLRHRGGGEP